MNISFEKQAFIAGKTGKWKSFEDWMESLIGGKEKEQIQSVLDTWNEHSDVIGGTSALKTIGPREKSIFHAIKKYGLDECKKAVQNYAEVIASPFFFSYLWDIKTFMQRRNGLPSFLDNGEMYLNYKKFMSRREETTTPDESEPAKKAYARTQNMIDKSGGLIKDPSIINNMFVLFFADEADKSGINPCECKNPFSNTHLKFYNGTLYVTYQNGTQTPIYEYQSKLATMIQRVKKMFNI